MACCTDFLRTLQSFEHLSEAEIDALSDALEERTLADGTVFIREGDHSEDVFFVMDGRVEITKEGQEGVEIRKTAGPGDILGLISLITREPRSATCAAKGPVRLAVMPLHASSLLLHGNAPLACAFQHALARQLVHDAREMNRMLAVSAHG